MKVSILVCTRNRPEDLEPCLEAIAATTYDEYELVLVDQSDDTRSQELAVAAARRFPLVYVRTDTRGKSKALNIGSKVASGEIIACTDDDCVPPPGWLDRIADIFGSEPSLDLLYGQVHVPEGLPDNHMVPSLYFDQRRKLSRGTIFGMGANMALTRALFLHIGGYDPVLGPGAPLACSEDFDFTYRAQLSGAVVVADPASVLIHRAHRNAEEWKRATFTYGVGDGAFYLKHARCNDRWAVGRILYQLAYYSARGVVNPLRGRKQKDDYLRGFIHGLAISRSYRIDRKTRLYRAKAEARHGATVARTA